MRSNAVIEIPLTRGLVGLIDDEDAAIVLPWKWRALKAPHTHYAIRGGGATPTLYLHRAIMAPPAGMTVDHRNHIGTDNRRSNLRLCSQGNNVRAALPRKNATSASQFKGVFLDKRRNRWYSHIMCDGVRHCLGLFDSELEAAMAYNNAAFEYFGEFAYINPLPGDSNATSVAANRAVIAPAEAASPAT
jgi:hypothetical protein